MKRKDNVRSDGLSKKYLPPRWAEWLVARFTASHIKEEQEISVSCFRSAAAVMDMYGPLFFILSK